MNVEIELIYFEVAVQPLRHGGLSYMKNDFLRLKSRVNLYMKNDFLGLKSRVNLYMKNDFLGLKSTVDYTRIMTF